MLKICLSVTVALIAATSSVAQERWIDTLPALRVGCASGQADASSPFDFSAAVKKQATEAGLSSIGVPFATEVHQDPGKTTVSWEACAALKNGETPRGGLVERVLPATQAIFMYCPGQSRIDESSCADRLSAWIKAKVADFFVPIRAVPLLQAQIAPATVQERSIKAISQTPLHLPPVLEINVAPVDQDDKKLLGLDQTARPLFTSGDPHVGDLWSQRDLSKIITQPLEGTTVFVPITDQQKVSLSGP